MDMEKNSIEEKLVADFLTKNKYKIPDNGFSQSVKHQLPSRLSLYERIMYIVFAIAGFMLSVYLNIWDVLLHYSKVCYAYLIAFFEQNSYSNFGVKRFLLESDEQIFSVLLVGALSVMIALFLKSRQYERS